MAQSGVDARQRICGRPSAINPADGFGVIAPRMSVMSMRASDQFIRGDAIDDINPVIRERATSDLRWGNDGIASIEGVITTGRKARIDATSLLAISGHLT